MWTSSTGARRRGASERRRSTGQSYADH